MLRWAYLWHLSCVLVPATTSASARQDHKNLKCYFHGYKWSLQLFIVFSIKPIFTGTAKINSYQRLTQNSMQHEDLLFNSSSLGKHRATIKNHTLCLKQTMDWMSWNKAENNVSLKLSAEDELSRFRHKMLSKELGCEQRGGQQVQSREIKQGGRGRQQHREVSDGNNERWNWSYSVVHGQRSWKFWDV